MVRLLHQHVPPPYLGRTHSPLWCLWTEEERYQPNFSVLPIDSVNTCSFIATRHKTALEDEPTAAGRQRKSRLIPSQNSSITTWASINGKMAHWILTCRSSVLEMRYLNPSPLGRMGKMQQTLQFNNFRFLCGNRWERTWKRCRFVLLMRPTHDRHMTGADDVPEAGNS